jgi:hypothetical protein
MWVRRLNVEEADASFTLLSPRIFCIFIPWRTRQGMKVQKVRVDVKGAKGVR